VAVTQRASPCYQLYVTYGNSAAQFQSQNKVTPPLPSLFVLPALPPPPPGTSPLLFSDRKCRTGQELLDLPNHIAFQRIIDNRCLIVMLFVRAGLLLQALDCRQAIPVNTVVNVSGSPGCLTPYSVSLVRPQIRP